MLPRQGAEPTLLSAIVGEGQGKPFSSPDEGLPGTAGEGGEVITSVGTLPHTTRVAGPALPHSCPCPCCQLSYAPFTSASSTSLSRQGTGPTLLSATAGKERGQIICSQELRACSHNWRRCWGLEFTIPAPMSLHSRRVTGPALLSSHPQPDSPTVP